MEINEFIEQDILVYLDLTLDKQHTSSPMTKPTVDPVIFLNRDYEKDFFAALEKQDYVAAKKIMEKLKQEFDECAPGTPDKAQLKALLLALYEKFKSEVEARQTFDKMGKGLTGNSHGDVTVHSKETNMAVASNGYFNLGVILYKQDKFAAALPHFEKALDFKTKGKVDKDNVDMVETKKYISETKSKC